MSDALLLLAGWFSGVVCALIGIRVGFSCLGLWAAELPKAEAAPQPPSTATAAQHIHIYPPEPVVLYREPPDDSDAWKRGIKPSDN